MSKSSWLLAVPLLVLVAVALTIAPNVWSNYRRTGQATLSNSAAFNLWVGLNDPGRRAFGGGGIVLEEYRRYLASAPTHAEREAALRAKITGLVREKGVVRLLVDQAGRQYFRLFDRESVLTAQLPGGRTHREDGSKGFRGPPEPMATSDWAAWKPAPDGSKSALRKDFTRSIQ